MSEEGVTDNSPETALVASSTVLVLTDRPKRLNIPYFEMPHLSSREDRLARLNPNSLSKLVGRRCAAWVNEHGNEIELVSTRNYVPLKTSFHAYWLAFHDSALVDSFIAAVPHYNIADQLTRLRAERESLFAKINSRLQTGKFDLSRLPE